jgi:2-polyprenyl-3-methyl-5-hydroxy-6-metoxy-1,4-benzoquinol methylase
MQNYQCKICGNTQGNQVVVAKEMMLGFRDEFIYFKCSSCGCLQITEPPKDLSKYYPSEGYYSYQPAVASNNSKEKLKNLLKWFFFNLGWYLKLPLQSLPQVRNSWLQALQKIAKTSAILDVGCGSGHLLQQMSAWGFNNLTGIDPFIEENILYPSGVRIWKTDVYNYPPPIQYIDNENINKIFELIMLHHSFEHMDNPREVLNRLHKLLSPEGTLLIRIPVSDSFAWRKYGTNWYQLDAPRHFFLHTTKSMALLAKDSGFVLERVVYDSTEGQLLQSEKYCRDVALHDIVNFLPSYVLQCKKQAKYLNKHKDGDQACFVLKKKLNNISPTPQHFYSLLQHFL